MPDGTQLIPDARVCHYWDPDARVGALYTPILAGLLDPAEVGSLPAAEQPAWDVWMLFGRDARWNEGAAPTPAWWEHQLSVLPERLRLDPSRFASKALALAQDPSQAADASKATYGDAASGLSGQSRRPHEHIVAAHAPAIDMPDGR